MPVGEERKEPVAVCQVDVHLRSEVVGVHLKRKAGEVIVLNVRVGWVRQIGRKRFRDRRNLRSRDSVSRECHLRTDPGRTSLAVRIVDDGWKRAQIARSLGQRRNGLKNGSRARTVSVTVVVAKEEDLVLLDGAAQQTTEFVLVIGGPGRREEASCVQARIAEVFENPAMEAVGSLFQNEI